MKSPENIGAQSVDGFVSRVEAEQSGVPISDATLIAPVFNYQDAGRDFVTSDRYYRWHYALGRLLLPRVVAEIGVRFGYSLFALCEASRSAGTLTEAVAIDAELYEPGSLAWVEKKFSALGYVGKTRKARGRFARSPRISTYRWNTQLDGPEAGDVIVPCAPYVDVFHVDGDHSMKGALRDLHLAWEMTVPGGCILVDDVDFIGDVNAAVRTFCEGKGIWFAALPTLRGTAVMFRV